MRSLVRAVCVAATLGVASLTVPTPVFANYPPSPDQVGRMRTSSVESAPTSCPSSAPSGSFRVSGTVSGWCGAATAAASSSTAAGAIRYAFANLGAAYSQSRRDQQNPNVYDCSSMVGRAFTAAGARVQHAGWSESFYPYFGWTGAYMPSQYANTNVVRVAGSDLRPGDIIIQFNGSSPANSAGNAGHAQIFLGNNAVIQSSSGLNVSPRYRGSFTNEWYFRYMGPGQPPAPPPPSTVPTKIVWTPGVFISADAVLGRTASPSVSGLQSALIAKKFATPSLRKSGPSGTYSEQTRLSVAKTQRSLGYTGSDADGILGPFSSSKLGLRWVAGTPYPVPVPLKTLPKVAWVKGRFISSDAVYGTVLSPSVKALQTALLATQWASAALRKEGVTGSYTPETVASVASLQRSMGYTGSDADGIVGRSSDARLGLVWVVGRR